VKSGPEPGYILGATDRQLYAKCDQVWRETGKWPTRRNVALAASQPRFYAARKRWAKDRGLKLPSPAEMMSHNVTQRHRLSRAKPLPVISPEVQAFRNAKVLEQQKRVERDLLFERGGER
jgi:hypothetical protein